MAVEVGSRNGELENGLKQRESRGRGTIGWVVERRMVEDGFSIPPSGKPHLAGDTHAKQEDGVLYHVYERVNTYTHVCPRKHEGHECAEEERLHTRECVLQKDWRCTYVYILLLLLCVPRMQTRGVLEVGAPTRERERAA
ncbi:hypothetical protein ALC60_06559 [Trachymyrmex zeteki]|uniref:Uncharacterized protein n=1 Tax=Mycetomoellerius zeteki TaxID=64791 RepID=A0A151X278_9HYME|nr:hypothetical protein ALC60_06559 [Trachymyrmex zeteki]